MSLECFCEHSQRLWEHRPESAPGRGHAFPGRGGGLQALLCPQPGCRSLPFWVIEGEKWSFWSQLLPLPRFLIRPGHRCLAMAFGRATSPLCTPVSSSVKGARPAVLRDDTDSSQAEGPAAHWLTAGAPSGLSLWTVRGREGAGPRGGWARSGFSRSTEENVYEGPQALGPLPPVEAREGADVPAAALHAALRVHLLPEQKVSLARGWGGPVPEAGRAAGALRCLVLVE